jgi:hypothetical protein
VLLEMENSSMRSTPSAAPGASRRARDALLLELGALVYELHRKGQRAPDLLQQKAVALDQVQAGLAPGEALPCPHCFAATEPNQLVCLECGETLGLGAPRVPKRRTPLIALAAVVALLGAAAAGFAVSELTSDDGGAAPAASAKPVADAAGKDSPSGGVAGSAESGDEEPVALAAWPEDLSAYTVVLVTSSDEAGARKVAWAAARSGLEAGLLRSDDYMELGEGFWLVFAGRFKTAAAAERRAAALGERYEGAYPQQVVPQAQTSQ